MIILNDFNGKIEKLPNVNGIDYDKIILDNEDHFNLIGYKLPKNIKTKIFVYGTLKKSKCRKNVLNNSSQKMVKAELKNYEYIDQSVLIDNEKYPNVIKSENKTVKGFIIDFSLNELEKLDIYETNNYKRIELIDNDFNKYWVYVGVN